MKGVLILFTVLLVLSIFTPVNHDSNILMCSVGSSDFGIALLGILFVILSRNTEKK